MSPRKIKPPAWVSLYTVGQEVQVRVFGEWRGAQWVNAQVTGFHRDRKPLVLIQPQREVHVLLGSDIRAAHTEAKP